MQETHRFVVEFSPTELETLAQNECRVPEEFIGARVECQWQVSGTLIVAFIKQLEQE